MGTSTLRHFDYLADHGSELERALGLNNLSGDVDFWRRHGMERPNDALTGCRRVMELSLKTIMQPLLDNRMSLRDLIGYAQDEGVLDSSMALKCHEIRKKGNQGAHALTVRAIDAQMVLDLLDDFLRWCAEDLNMIPAHTSADELPSDPIFIIRSSEEVAELTRKARIAAALDDNKELEKKAKKAKSEVEDCANSSMSDLQKMQELIKQAEKIGASAAEHKDKETIAAQRELFRSIERKIMAMNAENLAAGARFEEVSTEIRTVLNEHDFVHRLLHGDNQATFEQHSVMAFPRGSNSVTNILQIAGGAGTGKTLCLLAKLISEVDDHGQTNIFNEPGKKALFICFNKGLASYVRKILDGYEEFSPAIDVESYDLFVNQLVRSKPRAEYRHLECYSRDVRYKNERIIYGNSPEYVELLKEAQAAVATRHPERAHDYYLDSSNADDFEWVKDEILWIEARFASEEDAFRDYPKAARIGRGTVRRPNEQIRKQILEVWVEFNQLLRGKRFYTIDQATKRLLKSDSLPAYDAIAIDEVQDFAIQSIRLLLRFRRNDSTKMFLSGDENQKIYQRDFTWKQLDDSLRGYTITLHENMRNSDAIRSFSDRLIGIKSPHEASCRMVHVVNADDNRLFELLRKLADPSLHQTSVLITGEPRKWIGTLRSEGIPVVDTKVGEIANPGLYVISELQGKGLEFDNVVVNYLGELNEDEEAEKRLRYVHFSRARKRLYVRYQGTPPLILSKYYADFIGN